MQGNGRKKECRGRKGERKGGREITVKEKYKGGGERRKGEGEEKERREKKRRSVRCGKGQKKR